MENKTLETKLTGLANILYESKSASMRQTGDGEWHIQGFDREHRSMGTTHQGLSRACAFLLHGMLEYRNIAFEAALAENK